MTTATSVEQKVFTLLGPQREIYWDDRRYLFYKSGRGCGKTVSACMRIGGMIARGELLRGARILVTGPSYPQLKKGTLMSFDKWMGPEGLDLIQTKIDGNEPERRLVHDIVAYFRNASNPDQFRSHEIQLAWHDEAAQDKEELIPLTNANLRQFGDDAIYQTILTSTPRGKNWLYKMFINPETRMSEEMAGVYHITTVEAEALGIARPGYVEEMGYTPGTAMYDQEVLGLEVAWTGNVFHYQPDRDSPSPFILPRFKAVYGGIDIGTTAPTAVVLVGIDERGGYWVFREYYQKRADFHEVLKLIGEWHKEFKVKRWSIDAAANLEMRMMRSAGFPVTNSLKAKDAAGTAVNFINSLMERDMFRVSPDCPALIMELETYEHKEIMSGDEVTFLDKVKPNQPDHCLVAGTPVLVHWREAGYAAYRPIEWVREGDEVYTRKGWKRVMKSAMTNPAADVFDVKLSSGATMRGTGNHPVWVQNQGWTRLDALRYGDTMLTWQEASQLSETGSSIDDIPTQNDGQIAPTSRQAEHTAPTASAGSTKKSGWKITGQFLRDVTYIIWTAIRSTMSALTSSASRSQSTSKYISRTSFHQLPNDAILSEFAISPQRGTAHQKDEHGTANMADEPTSNGVWLSTTATFAVPDTAHEIEATFGSVPTSASPQRVEHPGLTTSRVSARTVLERSSSTATANSGTAPVYVESVTAVQTKHAVYNLSVEDAPEFFAHGVLVHNSIDALRYCIAPLSSAGAQQQYGRVVEFSMGSAA